MNTQYLRILLLVHILDLRAEHICVVRSSGETPNAFLVLANQSAYNSGIMPGVFLSIASLLSLRSYIWDTKTMITNAIGVIGTCIVIIAYFPQIYHLYKSKCAWGVSLASWVLWLVAGSLLFVYTLLRRDPVMMGVQIVNLTAIMATIFLIYQASHVCSHHLE